MELSSVLLKEENNKSASGPYINSNISTMLENGIKKLNSYKFIFKSDPSSYYTDTGSITFNSTQSLYSNSVDWSEEITVYPTQMKNLGQVYLE
jgi:hypothetical protein